MNDDELRTRLHRAVPDPPDPSGWADRARRRSATRSRTWLAGGVAVVALVLAGAVGWPWLNQAGQRAVPAAPPSGTASTTPGAGTPAGPTATPTTAPPSNAAKECGQLNAATRSPVPARADRLRLCPADLFTSEFRYPLLTVLDGERADAVLAVLADQKPLDTPACKADGGLAFWLVAETAGGRPVVMKLHLFGCREVGTADDVRTGSDAVLAEFLRQVPRQRQLLGPAGPAWTPATLCRDLTATPQSLVPAEPATMTSVTLCRYSLQGKADSMTPLSVADARAIIADISAHSAEAQRLPCPTAPPGTEPHAWRLALSNGYGDAILIESSCAGRFFYTSGTGAERQWVPSSTVARLLDRISAR